MLGRNNATCLLLVAFAILYAHSADPTTDPTPITTSAPPPPPPAPAPAPQLAPAPAPKPAPAPAPGSSAFDAYSFDTELSSLQGEYTLALRTHDQARPTWATVWGLGADAQQFSIYFWPPKYCHAIYVCPVPSQVYDGNRTFKDFDCDTSYLKYYPHINKLVMKSHDDAMDKVYYHMSYSLQFKLDSVIQRKYKIELLEEKPKSFGDWRTAKRITKVWDLFDKPNKIRTHASTKHLLILTNSRMCEVNMPGYPFHPVFDQEFAKSTKNWPNWLIYPGIDTKTKQFKPDLNVPTAYLPPLGGGTKTNDLLQYIKELQYSDKNFGGNTAKKCSSFEKISVFGTRKPIFESSPHVSVVSYQLDDFNANYPKGHQIKLQFTITTCTWVRFWMTKADIKDYATAMKPHETLDLFIKDGFYLAPDSNVAQPLPDSMVMTRLKLEVHRQYDGKGEVLDLIEMAFGAHGNNYLFRQFFKSQEFGAKAMKLHVIRSPFCETNLVLDNMYHSQSGLGELTNRRTAMSCSYSFFLDKKK